VVSGESKPAASTPLVNPHPDAINLQNSFAEIAEAVKPAVVNISAVQIQHVRQQDPQFYYGDPNEFFYRFFGQQAPQRQAPAPREYRTEGTGSGVIIDAEGYILTNNHVVQGADQLTVMLSNGKSFKGKVVGTDPRSDLAVIRIKGSNPFPFVPLGDSAAMRVGDWVLAIGSPFGLEQTVTSGIVSAIRQSLAIEGRNFRNLLQTDAAINRGNSGGPLVNIRGEVIGVNTAIYAPTGVFSGIGFAIPINDAKKILKDLIQKGYVERSWLGVEIAEVDEVIAQQFGLASAQGALINGIANGSPADKAGLRRGDPEVVTVDDERSVGDSGGAPAGLVGGHAARSSRVRFWKRGCATISLPACPDGATFRFTMDWVIAASAEEVQTRVMSMFCESW
jgi:serine protease Do